MSASLVGSEMCIRDRATPPVGLVVSGTRGPASKRHWCDAAVLPIPEMAVSYTHLTLPTICSV
eukprot:2988610-Alexandrium_andersonii.AAC.1